jgi:muramoyltetrapeptide carboxypeptidase LdcA involved in peptidoglycan recycling
MRPVPPGRLHRGDTVAVVSPSWGGPSRYPAIYDLGLSVLRDELGLQVREMSNARADAEWLSRHPEARAADLTAAFEDPDVRGIWCSIGGDDSMRLLPLLDPTLPRRHPKVVVGYSDSTAVLAWVRANGVVAFHGPSVMAGIAQWRSLPPEFGAQLRSVLFEGRPGHRYRPFSTFSEGYPDWGDAATLGRTQAPQPSEPWNWLNGRTRVEGELFGGSLETLDHLKGTPFFPPPEFFDGKVLFLETSEEHPTPLTVGRSIRNYGVAGILPRLRGLVLGRARGYSAEEREELDRRVRSVVVEEFGCTDLPIVTRLDFGHTDPQWVLPVGGQVRLDPEGPSFMLTEPAVA